MREANQTHIGVALASAKRRELSGIIGVTAA